MFTLILFNFSQYTPDLFQFGTNQPNEIYNSPNFETFSMETYKMPSEYIYLPIRVLGYKTLSEKLSLLKSSCKSNVYDMQIFSA